MLTTPNTTHEVLNQVPPLEGRNLFEDHAALREGARARGRRLGARAPARGRRLLGRRADALGRRGQRAPAGAAHPRPLRPPPRRGRVPPRLARAHARRRRAGAARAAVAHRPAGRPRRARRDLRLLGPGRGGLRLPDHDDLRRGPGAAHAARGRRRVGAAADRHELRPRAQAGRREGQRAVRHGDDREAGRLGRARQHHARAGGRRRLVGAHRPQVVLQRADVRPLPRPRADRRGRHLLRAAARAARRRAQRGLPAAAPQGQARQPLQRLERGRVPRRPGADGRRARPRRADDHRDGQPHAPGLRHRDGGRDARGGRRTRPGTPRTAAPSASAWPTSR